MTSDKQRKLAPNHSKEMRKGINDSFVGCCDGITYGVDDTGHPFHTGKRDWEYEAMIRWAKANGEFYKSVAQRLEAFGKAVEHKVMPGASLY